MREHISEEKDSTRLVMVIWPLVFQKNRSRPWTSVYPPGRFRALTDSDVLSLFRCASFLDSKFEQAVSEDE